MRLFKKLRRKLDYLTSEEILRIYEAFLLALEAHRGQKRRTGEPYITHPVAVACILAELRLDAQSIMAALLHDVIEDTPVQKRIIAEKFGDQVANLVDGVSKLTQIEFVSRAEAQAENFRKMVMAMAHDIRVILVKLADRLHNMRTLGSLSEEKRIRISRETLDIFAPIAKRLGMRELSVELEELGFQARYPMRYKVLKEAVRKARGNRKKILGVIEKTLYQNLSQSNIPSYTLAGREKHLYSIYRKMQTKHIPFDDIMDVYAFRIIVDSVDTCYRVLGVVHGTFKPVPERFKDYIAIPKANGYQSLHTTLFGPYGLPIEVQIRTTEMDRMASNGIAAHWLYKTDDSQLHKSRVRAQKWVKNLLELQQRSGSSLEFIESVKVDLFPDEVYVFTPRGAIMELPSGATPVDFAYAVHTDIGNTCVAAKVDRQVVPLSSVLVSGQTIEVMRSDDARPNPAWLDFVVTSKARSAIRHFLKYQQRSESFSLGKQLLKNQLASHGLALRKIPKAALEYFMQETQSKSWDDILVEIGLGNRAAALVAQRLTTLVSEHADWSQAVLDTESSDTSPRPLAIKGTEGLVMHFATCCYPVPGDPIAGIVDTGSGVVVHMQSCAEVMKLLDEPNRCMPLRWSETIEGEFLTILRVMVINERGLLATLALAASDADANIVDISVQDQDGRLYLVTFKLLVRSRDHLARVVKRLRQVKNVTRVLKRG